jgi:multidrug resistance protein MdtO
LRVTTLNLDGALIRADSTHWLSYFGLQVALAFYLINLQEFAIQTSLAVARDRVVGVLVGLFVMWLVFDQLWGASAAAEMKHAFISTLRLLSQFIREPLSKDLIVAVERSFSLRETINNSFDQVRALADGVLFEFGPSRQHDLALRSRIYRLQPLLRTLFFLTRTALWKYRAQLPGFTLPQAVAVAQLEFDRQLATTLESMASRLEGNTREGKGSFENASEPLEDTVRNCCAERPLGSETERLQTFLTLSRSVANLTASLEREI